MYCTNMDKRLKIRLDKTLYRFDREQNVPLASLLLLIMQ